MPQVVWLKRDLRLRDHQPLFQAAKQDELIILYVYEPSVMTAEDFDACHLEFINQSLTELDEALASLGAHITYRHGEVVEVLDRLHHEHRFSRIWSHEETGNAITYDRDKAVARWARANSVRWTEIAQFGVFRPLEDRDGWAKRWDEMMWESTVSRPESIDCVPTDSGSRLTSGELGLEVSTKLQAQPGGEFHAWSELETFLSDRGVNYRADMSSPVEGWRGCSRISPYLTFGNISMREVFQTTKSAVSELRARKDSGEPVDGRWFKSLSSFEGRLHWHCHFMQKLEDEPAIEFENMSRVFDGIRDDFNDDYFQAWCEGQTGYPMVDACMRCLHATGWLNFRMRAMLVSFASYHLWLDWRPTSKFLARQFLDYEPGIHYSQFQMQSGVTGINSIRIYSPAKQVTDQDPKGVFIRQWVPELEHVPDRYLPEPHTMPGLEQLEVGCVVGKDYPAPIVDHKTAYREAKDRIWSVRKTSAAKAEAKLVYEKHGSRKRPRR